MPGRGQTGFGGLDKQREGSAVRAAGGQLAGAGQLRRRPTQRREKTAAEIVETKHGSCQAMLGGASCGVRLYAT